MIAECCGPKAYLRGICEGDGIQGRGEVSRDVVETGSCRTTSESHKGENHWQNLVSRGDWVEG